MRERKGGRWDIASVRLRINRARTPSLVVQNTLFRILDMFKRPF